jgi:hypothetical protein
MARKIYSGVAENETMTGMHRRVGKASVGLK